MVDKQSIDKDLRELALFAGAGGASSPENFSDGELSAQSSGNPTPQAYCAPDKMTAFSRLSRFGMMFAPLTESLGEGLLMWYREDFLARTYQQQEKEPDLTENDQDSGQKCLGSFVRYDHDTSLWRTHQYSLLGGLDEFLETWPQWGLMQGGECWERQTLAHLIGATESGLSLPTPCKNEYAGTSKKRFQGSPHFRGAKTSEALRTCEADPSYLHPQFIEKIMGFPIMWTGLAALEMRKSHCAQQQHGEFSVSN